jgi:hypothetical protein
LVAGRENAYREIEEETARLSASLGCPHPYLAMESLTGPKEIWWFNGFDSPEDQRQVAEAYQKNTPFSAALKKNSDRKAPVTGKVIEVVAQYRSDLTSGIRWVFGHGHFLAIAVSKDRPSRAGTFFKQPTEHSSFSHRLEFERRPIVLRPQFQVQQSSWYGPPSVFRQRTGSPPIRDSGEPMRDDLVEERRRPACRFEEATDWVETAPSTTLKK